MKLKIIRLSILLIPASLLQAIVDTNQFQNLLHSAPNCIGLQCPDTFGVTHFIVGYPHEAPKKQTKNKPQEKSPVALTDKHVLFSPDDDVEQALMQLIKEEQKGLKIAIFSFTNKNIAQALIDAHQRGIHVQVVCDPAQGKDRYSKIAMLKEAGIQVFEYDPNYVKDMRSNLMHHKFMIVGDDRTVTGSYNWTKAANERNQENIVILKDKEIAQKFHEQFDRLKGRCVHCKQTTKMVSGKQKKRQRFAVH